MFKKSTSS